MKQMECLTPVTLVPACGRREPFSVLRDVVSSIRTAFGSVVTLYSSSTFTVSPDWTVPFGGWKLAQGPDLACRTSASRSSPFVESHPLSHMLRMFNIDT